VGPSAGVADVTDTVELPSERPPPGARIDRLARDGLLALVGAGVSAVVNFALVFMVIHAAGKVTAGVVFAATSLFLIAETAARLGAPTGLMYFLVRARTQGRVSRLRGVFRAGLVPVAVASVLLGTALFVFAPQISHRMIAGHPDLAVTPMRVLALLVPFAAMSDSLLFAARAFGTMRPLVFVERIARPLGQVLLMGVAIALGAVGAAALSAAWVLPYVGTCLVAVVWVTRLLHAAEAGSSADGGDEPRPGVRRHRRSSGRHDSAAAPVHPREATPWRRYWTFTTPRALQSVVQIALQRFDVVLVAAILGPAKAAVYAAVTRFLVFGQVGQQSIAAAVQPQLGALLVDKDHEGAQRIYQVSTCWLVLLCWPIYLTIAVFSKQIPEVFGKGYAAGTAVLLLLSFAMLFATGSGMVDSVLAMAGKTSWTFANTTLALVLDVSLNIILLPRIGILGAGIAWSVAIFANNALPLTQLALAMRLHPFGRGTLLAMLSAAAWLGALPFVVGHVLGDGAAVLVAGMTLGLCGYLVTAWRLKHVFELDALVRATRWRKVARVAHA
jgi:O-antigen/teichoic acid export membrane protein